MSAKTFSIALLILIAAIITIAALSMRGLPMVVTYNLERLPMKIAGFVGTEDAFSAAVYRELNADKHVYRHYRDDNGRQVDLYIGYYGTAKGGRTPHNPQACLSGAGWGISENSQITLRMGPEERPVQINYILARKKEQHETILHWYQSAGDKVLATGIQQNIRRFISKILYNRNDGAFVRVSVFSRQESLAADRELAEEFAGIILNMLPDYWPVEQ